MKPTRKDDAGNMIANPFYVIVLKDDLFGDHEMEGAKEDWADKNVQLMEEIGSRDWLNQLLLALSPGTEPDHVRDTIVSPYKGIIFSETLQGDHKPIIAREQWVQANMKLMKELSVGEWLWRLLDVLENGGPADPD